MGKDKTSAEGFIGGDDSTLCLDNDVYKSLQAKLKRSAEALVFDKSAFDLESKVCGTEGMLLLASYWHSVVESSDLLRDFLVNDVDKCLSDIQRSINQTDEECARSFNLEEPEDGAKASVLAQMGDIGPGGKFQKAVVRGISEDVKKPTLDEILRSTAGTDKHKKMREGAKLLAAFAGDIEKPIEDAGNKVLNFLNKNSVYRDLALPGLSNIFTLGAGIQSYLETGGFGDTEKNTRINLAAFQRGGLKAEVESVTGLMKMPDLAYKIGNGLTGVMNEGARYIKESGVENLPEDLAVWAGEKGAQAKAIYNVIKDSATDKLKGMSVEEYYEASGDVAANVVMFFAGGGSGTVAKGGEAAKASEAAEKTAATMEEFLQLADKTDDVVKFADTASDATKLADAAGDVAKIAEEAGDVAKIADGSQTVSKIADTAADVAQGAEKAGSTAEAFVSKVDDVAEVAAEEADDVARAAEEVVAEPEALLSNKSNGNGLETDYYVGPNGKALPSQYKDWIGTNMQKELMEQASNPQLKNAIKELYRGKSFIGDGGTADVIRFEKETGIMLGRNQGSHVQKGIDMAKYLENKILTQNLNTTDSNLAMKLLDDLKSALGR